METSEIIEEIKLMSENSDRIERVKRFIAEDPKFQTPFYGDLLRPIPQCLLFLLEYEGPIDHFTEARYYSQRDIPIIEQETYNYFANEIAKMRSNDSLL